MDPNDCPRCQSIGDVLALSDDGHKEQVFWNMSTSGGRRYWKIATQSRLFAFPGRDASTRNSIVSGTAGHITRSGGTQTWSSQRQSEETSNRFLAFPRSPKNNYALRHSCAVQTNRTWSQSEPSSFMRRWRLWRFVARDGGTRGGRGRWKTKRRRRSTSP